MTIDKAIVELKMMVNQTRTDFYPERRKALEMAITALYEAKHEEITHEG